MAESEGERLGKGSAAELLATWRAAERDEVAAGETADAAAIAVIAAKRAAAASRETADAARLSLEAAQRAEHAARETADAADLLHATVVGQQETADAALVDSQAATAVAKDAFNTARRLGFPKDTKPPADRG